MRRLSLLRSLVPLSLTVLLVAPGCGEGEPGGPPVAPAPAAADGKADGAGSTTPKYTDVVSYTVDNGGYDEWSAMVANLKKEFDNICGDTFCGGDYPPWTITLNCSVALADGKLKNCSWLFAASYETINPTLGTIAHHKKFYTCKLPWGGLTTGQLSELLKPPTGFGDEALQRSLPSGKSTYDALGDCELGQ